MTMQLGSLGYVLRVSESTNNIINRGQGNIMRNEYQANEAMSAIAQADESNQAKFKPPRAEGAIGSRYKNPARLAFIKEWAIKE